LHCTIYRNESICISGHDDRCFLVTFNDHDFSLFSSLLRNKETTKRHVTVASRPGNKLV
uniref:DUF5659 domain-containing protein n=1 Tax=Gongylonema pulchrum TaxID=637853 RepID=A0A183D6Z1_9BILA